MKLPNHEVFESINSQKNLDVDNSEELDEKDIMSFDSLNPFKDIKMDAKMLSENGKEFSKAAKAIVRAARSSSEYRRFIRFLKDNLNLTRCTFMNKIDTSKVKGVKLEFHHYPFTIFELASIVLRKHISDSGVTGKIDEFLVTDELMKIHYEGLVGLVPLTKTPHQMAHNGSLFIPLSVPFGNIKEFVLKYRDYMSDGEKNSLLNLIKLSNDIDEEYVNSPLSKKVTTMDLQKVAKPIGKIEVKRDSEEEIS